MISVSLDEELARLKEIYSDPGLRRGGRFNRASRRAALKRSRSLRVARRRARFEGRRTEAFREWWS